MNRILELSAVMFKEYPDCVNIKQLQEMLGVKRTKTYEILKNGEIKAKKIGKDYKIPKYNVIAYLFNEEQL